MDCGKPREVASQLAASSVQLAAALGVQLEQLIRNCVAIDVNPRLFMLLDLQGLDTAALGILREALGCLVDTFSRHYPGLLGHLLITHAPVGLGKLLRRSGVDQSAMSNVCVLPGDGFTKMIEFVESEGIPRALGGQCMCEEGWCLVGAASEPCVQAASSPPSHAALSHSAVELMESRR